MSQVPPIAERASTIAKLRSGQSRCRWQAAPIPDSPAPTIRTSTCSASGPPAEGTSAKLIDLQPTSAGAGADGAAGGADQRCAAGLGPDHLVAPGADADQGHRRADMLGDEVEVLAGRLRQVRQRPALPQILLPSRQLGQLADAVMEDRLVVGEVLE